MLFFESFPFHSPAADINLFCYSASTCSCTQVGRTGWHIDGSFQEAPFSHSIYHIIECPQKGATVFAPLTEIIENMESEVSQSIYYNYNIRADFQVSNQIC